MPDFSKAVIGTVTEDLSEYVAFLKKRVLSEVCEVPLKPEETTRKVMRAFNKAADQLGIRLARIVSSEDSVRFKVVPQERRKVNLSPEARRARVEKAKATRASKRH